MYSIYNKTNTTIAAGPITLGPHEEITIAYIPEELSDALSKGFVEVATFDQTSRLYNLTVAHNQVLTVTDTSTASDPVNFKEVMLCATQNMFITVAREAATAGPGPGNIPLMAGEKFHLQLSPGSIISAIRQTNNGSLYIIPTRA
jgi:hypothetical protein